MTSNQTKKCSCILFGGFAADTKGYRMNNILAKKKAIIAAVLFGVLFLILRIVQLENAVEYPSGFYAAGNELFNGVFNILLAVGAAAIAALAFFDCRNSGFKSIDKISTTGASSIGIFMILGGASMSLSVIGEFTNGLDFFSLFTIAGCAAYLAGGMIILAKGKITPPLCVSAIIVIIYYLLKCVDYYLANPIITGMPQKFMLMLFYVVSVLFWINTGRLFSGVEKKLTRAAAVTSGLFLGALTCAYAIGGMLFSAVDGEKWLMLSDMADIELTVTGFVSAAIAVALMCSKQRGENDTELSAEALQNTGASDGNDAIQEQNDTENTSEIN